MLTIFRSLFPALCTGVLLGLAFPLRGMESLPLGWIAVVAFVPLGVDLCRAPRSPSRVFAEALLAYLVAYGIAFHWVVFHPIAAAALASTGGVMVLAMFAALPWAAGAWLQDRPWLKGRSWAPGLALPATWAVGTLALEHLISIGPWALPWTVLSLTQALLPQAAVAAVAGAPALSALVIAANAGLIALIAANAPQPTRVQRRHRAFHRTRPVHAAAAGLPITILVGVAIFASLRTHAPAPASAAQLTLVQPAIPAETWARTDTLGAVRRLQAMTIGPPATSPAATSPDDTTDLIVWPETALPPPALQDPTLGRSYAAPLLTGAVRPIAPAVPGAYQRFQNEALLLPARRSRPSASNESAFNNSALSDTVESKSVTTGVQRYAKHHLVPFAEHVPLVNDLPLLRHLTVPAGGVAGYERGPGPTVFSIPTHSPPQQADTGAERSPNAFRFAPAICFETTIGPYMREIRRKGPEAVVALSQVGWWGETAVLPQYRALTSLRARETGLPIIVATVSGPSFTARPDGRVDLHTSWMAPAVVNVLVPPAVDAPYANAGWLADALVSLALLAYLVGIGFLGNGSPHEAPSSHGGVQRDRTNRVP